MAFIDHEIETLETVNEFIEHIRNILADAGCETCENAGRENGLFECTEGCSFGERGCIRKHLEDKIEGVLTNIDLEINELLDYLSSYYY